MYFIEYYLYKTVSLKHQKSKESSHRREKGETDERNEGKQTGKAT